MAKVLNNRSENDIKNKWNSMWRMKNRKQNKVEEKSDKPAEVKSMAKDITTIETIESMTSEFIDDNAIEPIDFASELDTSILPADWNCATI
jgi:hypothetical protein